MRQQVNIQTWFFSHCESLLNLFLSFLHIFGTCRVNACHQGFTTDTIKGKQDILSFFFVCFFFCSQCSTWRRRSKKTGREREGGGGVGGGLKGVEGHSVYEQHSRQPLIPRPPLPARRSSPYIAFAGCFPAPSPSVQSRRFIHLIVKENYELHAGENNNNNNDNNNNNNNNQKKKAKHGRSAIQANVVFLFGGDMNDSSGKIQP